MLARFLVISLLLAPLGACSEKPQERGPSDQFSAVHARGAGDPLRQRAAAQNEAGRINY